MGLSKRLINNWESSEAGYLQKAYCLLSKCNVFDLLVIFICAASLCCSLIESITNNDNLHWGWQYIAALDLKRGAIPHSEVLIFYGYIQVLIQSIALSLFGERLMSVGIITGLFYSFTLFLSYRIFLRFLKKSLAFIAVLLIFLIHPYIIYPFPNYFAYTFQLLALIFFLRYSEHHLNGLLAGFFLSMSVLSRYSSVIAILPPFIILLLWDFFAVKEERKNAIKKIVMVTGGFVVPLGLFFLYLLVNSALDDFFNQNKILINMMGRVSDIDTWLNFLGCIFQIEESIKGSFAFDFRGRLFTLILLVCMFVIIWGFIRKISGGVSKSTYARYDIMATCLVAVFGFLNSVHVYETFRLVNGASLGVGICVLVFYNYYSSAIKPLKYIIVFATIFVCLFLSSSLFFKTTTSSYYPWKRDILFGNGVTNKTIGIFKGKILTKEYNDFYQEVFDTIAPFKNCCYILNYTQDIIAFSMNDLPRVQISPIHFPGIDDVSKQEKLIKQNKAVILSCRKLDLPGYSLIFAKKWPEEIPWIGGGYLFIYVPLNYTR
jgi:hypothetical protein